MPTKDETRALLFLSALALFGAGARLVRDPAPLAFAGTADTTVAALDRHRAAVDSASRGARTSSRRKATTADRRRPRRTDRSADDGADVAPRPRTRASGRGAPVAAVAPARPVDLDTADSLSLERLPGIGPALAGRILADRARHGPFGSLDALQRVRGIGPALAGRLAGHVTFSTLPRP